MFCCLCFCVSFVLFSDTVLGFIVGGKSLQNDSYGAHSAKHSL